LDAPRAAAVVDDQEAFSYEELSERVVAIASGLSVLGVAPGDRVALYADNSAAFVTVALGCLWLGAPFVPLSVRDPHGRIARIVADCAPALVVTAGLDEAGVPQFGTTRAVAIEDVLDHSGPTPPRAEDPERDAYMVYTSGTTGSPKGVRIPERAFRWSVTSSARLFCLDRATRALCVSPFHFDGSYGTLFPTLVAGGGLVVPKRDDLLFLKNFCSAVLHHGVTHTSFSPSYLRLLVSSRHLGRLAGSELRTLAVGGEECIAEDVAKLWGALPDLKVFNRYGPTEATIAVTTYEISPVDVKAGKVPIGTPHAGVSFSLVRTDGTDNLVERAGEVGELYIGGEQLMRGYWGDEEFSRAVLRTDVVPGEVLYKTGDLAYRDDSGRYFYWGRSDDVVKRNDVRISLSEAASALRGVEGVTGAVCLAIDHDGRLGIAAFVEAGSDMTAAKLLNATSSELPFSMRPDEVFIVSALPVTTAGKIDRRRLLADAGRREWQEG
jgi:amino acid adenylation domain-containing protein